MLGLIFWHSGKVEAEDLEVSPWVSRGGVAEWQAMISVT